MLAVRIETGAVPEAGHLTRPDLDAEHRKPAVRAGTRPLAPWLGLVDGGQLLDRADEPADVPDAAAVRAPARLEPAAGVVLLDVPDRQAVAEVLDGLDGRGGGIVGAAAPLPGVTVHQDAPGCFQAAQALVGVHGGHG